MAAGRKPFLGKESSLLNRISCSGCELLYPIGVIVGNKFNRRVADDLKVMSNAYHSSPTERFWHFFQHICSFELSQVVAFLVNSYWLFSIRKRVVRLASNSLALGGVIWQLKNAAHRRVFLELRNAVGVSDRCRSAALGYLLGMGRSKQTSLSRLLA